MARVDCTTEVHTATYIFVSHLVLVLVFYKKKFLPHTSLSWAVTIARRELLKP